MTQDLLYISLINGTDLVAGKHEENDLTVSVKYPLKVYRGFVESGEYSILTDFVPYQIDEVTTFEKRNIVATTQVSSHELADLYTSYLMKQILKKGFEENDVTDETIGTLH